jgi:type VI protein secretion system component Hcp
MILLRLNDLGGQYCEITGGKKIEKYHYGEIGAGWFPVNSIDFGFLDIKSPSEGETAANGGNQSAGTSARTSSSAGAPRSTGGGTGSGGGDGQDEKTFSHLSVSRGVDAASTLLMGFAMADRQATKAGEQVKTRKADIHFLHSVAGFSKTKDNEMYVYPYLMITLASVLVAGWKITAQGDDRPTEQLTLWYDKVAMRYFRTKDGQVWNTVEPKGWDQYNNEPWEAPFDGANYFNMPPQ